MRKANYYLDQLRKELIIALNSLLVKAEDNTDFKQGAFQRLSDDIEARISEIKIFNAKSVNPDKRVEQLKKTLSTSVLKQLIRYGWGLNIKWDERMFKTLDVVVVYLGYGDWKDFTVCKNQNITKSAEAHDVQIKNDFFEAIAKLTKAYQNLHTFDLLELGDFLHDREYMFNYVRNHILRLRKENAKPLSPKAVMFEPGFFQVIDRLDQRALVTVMETLEIDRYLSEKPKTNNASKSSDYCFYWLKYDLGKWKLTHRMIAVSSMFELKTVKNQRG